MERADTFSLAEIESLCARIPPLSDKLVLDLVNGLEVTREHIRVRERRQGFMARAYDAVTGQGARRQQRIDQNLAAGLQATTAWIQALQVRQLETDRGMKLVADKLTETRHAVLKLARHHAALRDDVLALSQGLEAFEQATTTRFDRLEAQVGSLQRGQAALTAIEVTFARWSMGEWFTGFSPLVQAMLAVEALYWSPLWRLDGDQADLRAGVRARCAERLVTLSATPLDTLLPTEAWLSPLDAEPEPVRAMLAYWFDGGDPREQPLAAAVGARAADKLGRAVTTLPHVLSPRTLANGLVREAARRAEQDVQCLLNPGELTKVMR